MYCNRCGAQLPSGSLNCTNCGAAIVQASGGTVSTGAPPPLPGTYSRVRKHIKPLGVLWCITGALFLLPALALGGMGTFASHFLPNDEARFFAPIVMSILSVVLLVTAALGFLTGVGLLKAWPSARVLAIVMGIISLAKFPLGTALGIYTLWVLLSRGAEAEYQALARG